MRALDTFLFVVFFSAIAAADALETEYIAITASPERAATISELVLKSVPGNQAGPGGLLQEGFGVSSPYVPNRRINEQSEFQGGAWQYRYDCEGPNIQGLHVTRTVEPVPGEASIRVRWRIENKGKSDQWVAPWVRNEVTLGGVFDPADGIDMPTLDGVMQVKSTGYRPLSRNWVAVTDPNYTLSLCGVFHSDHLHSALALWEQPDGPCGFHAALVPRLLEPGAVWDTVYRVNVVRGLKRVDFASQEIAIQIDYAPGVLHVLVATVKPLQEAQIHPSILAEDGKRWKLAPKKFTTDPNRIIRCTFEWTAPGAGTYQFLAQLKDRTGKPIDLNSEMAPPHGGIDTQFLIGPMERGQSMPAWTDAPHALDRGPRKRPRPVGAFGPAALWVETSLEKVFPQDSAEPEPGKRPLARVSMARREYESFQIVLRPSEGRPLKQVQWTCSNLLCEERGGRIESSNLRGYNVRYYPVRIPSHFEGPTGDTPDALPAFKPFTAPSNRSSSIWFTLYVPPDTPAGLYKGLIELTAADVGAVEVPLEVVVYDFQLPVTPGLKTDFFFWHDEAVKTAKALKTALADQEIIRRYIFNALQHRVTLRSRVLPGPGGVTASALSESLKQIRRWQERGATTFAVSNTLLAAPDQLKQVDAFVAENKLGGVVFCPFVDSPKPETWPDVIEKMKAWKKTAPHIPAMATTYGLQPFLNDCADIWAVHSQVMDTVNNAPVLERIKQGGEVWWFPAQGPSRPYANFFIDFAAIEHRIFFWQTWALGMRGVHYWGVNYAGTGRDPYVNQLDNTPVNGDGFLLYPGPDGPVNSIRWEVIRDGIEDYDYLMLFMQQIKRAKELLGKDPLIEQAVAVYEMSQLVPDLVSFPRDPALLYRKRDEIARMIVELARATS